MLKFPGKREEIYDTPRWSESERSGEQSVY